MGSAFKDPLVEPTDLLIRRVLGPSAQLWAQVVTLFEGAGASVTWRHYRDGGWLANAARGGKTVAWLVVEEGFVAIAFYFAQRHRETLTASEGIPQTVRDRIGSEPMIGKVFPVAFEVRSPADITPVESVLAVKLFAK